MHALLVANAPDDGFADGVVDAVSSADLVIAVDGGGAYLESLGCRPDLVVGDLDSLTAASRAKLIDAGIEFETYPADKDASDLRLGIAAAVARGATRLTVARALDGRLDHSLGAFGAAIESAVPYVAFIGASQQAAVARQDTGVLITGDGATFSVFGLSCDSVVSIVGARWELAHEPVPGLSTRGVSNIVTGGQATVTAHEGVIVVIAPATEGRVATLSRA